MIGGGLVRKRAGGDFRLGSRRKLDGRPHGILAFADGASATAVYNGYGYFSTIELCADVTEWGSLEPVAERPPVNPRRGEAAARRDELQAKRRRAKGAIPASAPFQPTFGLTLVSCEKGDIRQSPRGLYVYSADGREEIVLPNDQSPRDLVLDEFHDALTGRRKPVHDGRWGIANLEVCIAAIESAQTGQEITLRHQIAAPQ